jgi:nucleoside-diphosphate-sugar epimerase
VKELVRDGGVTHIVHLAAVLIPYCQANPVAGAMVNVIGTLNVFEAARDAGRQVRIAYASSSAVWGPEEAYGEGKINEDQEPKPATHYGIFKHSNEGNARVFYALNGISSVGLRPWSVYGVGRDAGMTADPTLAIRALALDQPFQIRLTGYMDLQYVEDVAEAFVRSLLGTFEGAHVFNLEGAAIRMDEFIQVLERLRPGASKLVSASGPQVPVAWRMDGSRIRQMIPDVPNTALEEGVKKTLEIFQQLARENRIMPVRQ